MNILFSNFKQTLVFLKFLSNTLTAQNARAFLYSILNVIILNAVRKTSQREKLHEMIKKKRVAGKEQFLFKKNKKRKASKSHSTTILCFSFWITVFQNGSLHDKSLFFRVPFYDWFQTEMGLTSKTITFSVLYALFLFLSPPLSVNKGAPRHSGARALRIRAITSGGGARSRASNNRE